METSAFVIISDDATWIGATRFVNRLLHAGVPVLLVREAIEPATLAAGSFVIPVAGSSGSHGEPVPSPDRVERLAADYRLRLAPLPPAATLVVRPAHPVRIGLYGGGGAPFNHAAILASCGFAVEFLSDVDVRTGRLAEVDVFVMPGGGARAMEGQLGPLGETGCRAIAAFVRAGGLYLGCCAGAYDCLVNDHELLTSCPAQRCLELLNAAPWIGDDEHRYSSLQSPGVGVVRVQNERPRHPVMAGMPTEFAMVHYNGPVLHPLRDRVVDGASATVGLARFVGSTNAFTPAERFAGERADAGPTYLDRAIAAGRFAVAAGEFEQGRVVAFGSHPEFGADLPMAAWGTTARLLVNAVLWQATDGVPASRPAREGPFPLAYPPGAGLAAIPGAAEAVAAAARRLAERSLDPVPPWLVPAYAMSTFGLAPAEIWRRALAEIPALADEASAAAEELSARIAAARRPLPGPLAAAVRQIDRWVLHERSPEWGQDHGFRGARALLRDACRMCERAEANWEIELGLPAGPYDYLEENPYHQVAGSYLAAIGLVAGAAQLMRGLRALWAQAEAYAGDAAAAAPGGEGSDR